MFPDVGKEVFEHVQSVDLRRIANRMLTEAANYKVWLFSGEMGAGKTTFIKVLCSELGVVDSMSSPTFSIINEYATEDNGRVFHFDFFRIKSTAEAYDIGIEEYFYSGNYCFIEWPEKIVDLIPEVHAHVNITLESQSLRTIALTVHDGKEKNRI
jgi:tRNA threonylcarbamoyladenosine biosynthesis protein TsaE